MTREKKKEIETRRRRKRGKEGKLSRNGETAVLCLYSYLKPSSFSITEYMRLDDL